MPHVSLKQIHEQYYDDSKENKQILKSLGLSNNVNEIYKRVHLFKLKGSEKVLTPKELKKLPLNFNKKRLEGPIGYDEPIDLESLKKQRCIYTVDQLRKLLVNNVPENAFNHLMISGGTLDTALRKKFNINSTQFKDLTDEQYNKIFGSHGSDQIIVREGVKSKNFHPQSPEVIEVESSSHQYPGVIKEETLQYQQPEIAVGEVVHFEYEQYQNNNNTLRITLAEIHNCIAIKRFSHNSMQAMLVDVLSHFGFASEDELNLYINQFFFKGDIVSFETLTHYFPEHIKMLGGINGYYDQIILDRVDINCYSIKAIQEACRLPYGGKNSAITVENFLRLERGSLIHNILQCFGVSFEGFTNVDLAAIYGIDESFRFNDVKAILETSLVQQQSYQSSLMQMQQNTVVQNQQCNDYGHDFSEEYTDASSYQSQLNNWHQVSQQQHLTLMPITNITESTDRSAITSLPSIDAMLPDFIL